MHVVIAKVDEIYFDGEAYSLTVPAKDGLMTILGEHMPLITTLVSGSLMLKESAQGEGKEFPIDSGVLEVRRDGATVVL